MTIPIVYDRGDDEYIKNIGFNGVEVGAEGPFSKKKNCLWSPSLLPTQLSLFSFWIDVSHWLSNRRNA